MDGVTYYYTLDGNTPTSDSTIYTEKVTLTAPDSDEEDIVTIKVIGIKEDAIDSEVATATVTYAAQTVSQHILTITGEGITTEPEPGLVDEGILVTVTVTPATGQRVATFTINGTDKKAKLKDGKYTFTIVENTTIEVTYEAIPNEDQEPPVGLTGQAPTSKDGSDGSIIGVTGNMEYRFKGDNEWISVSEGVNEITGLAPGTYEVRYAACQGYNASPAVEVVVPEYKALKYIITFGVIDGNGALTARVEDEIINSGAEVEDGETVVFTAFPDEGYQVKQWVVDNQPVEGNNSLTYTLQNVEKAKSVTVEFEKTTHTITFDSNGGNAVNPMTDVMYGETITMPDEPTKGGYTFAGWFMDKQFNTNWDFEKDTVTETITLYAKWEPKSDTLYKVEHYQQDIKGEDYTLANEDSLEGTTGKTVHATDKQYTGFTLNENKSQMSGLIEADGSLVLKLYYDRDTFTVEFDTNGGTEIGELTDIRYGAKISAPTEPGKAGHTFVGWYRDNNFDTEWSFDSDTVTEKVTLYGKWEVNSYTVSFDVDGGSEVDSQTIGYGNKVTKPIDPTKPGYAFAGWFMDEQFKAEWNFETNAVTKPITLYAKWEPNSDTPYKVEHYQQNLGDDGYTLADTENLTGTTNTSVMAEAKNYPGFVENADHEGRIVNGTIKVDGGLVLKLYYDRDTFTVKFVTDSDTEIDDIPNVRYGAKIDAPMEPERVGHTFAGWFKDANFNTSWNFYNDTVTEDVALYAKWEIIVYTVSFDVDGADAIEPQVVEHGGKAVRPEEPAKEGHAFIGWYVDWDCEAGFDFDSEITADTTIYAKWELKKYAVGFEIAPADLDVTIIVKDGAGIERESETDGIYRLEAGEYNYFIEADGHVNMSGSFEVHNQDKTIDIVLVPYTVGDEVGNGFYVVNRIYNDNVKKSDPIGSVPINIAGEDVSWEFEFSFYDKENGDPISVFDLSNGGTTFKAYMKATSDEYGTIAGNVVFKYRSVTIGIDSDDYYTIEDALAKAKSGDTIYVRHNTSFANENVAQFAYGGTEFVLEHGVTLLLPFDANMKSEIGQTGPSNAPGIKRDSPYVQLLMLENINLIVKGTLTVNAQLSAGTPRAGYVVEDNYSQLKMLSNSKITVDRTGIVNSIGFIFGEGTIETISGAVVNDTLFVSHFRGGTITNAVFDTIFPFDQFSFHNIEVPVFVNEGSFYNAKVVMYAKSYVKSEIPIIGDRNSSALVNLSSGTIVKNYDVESGVVSLDFYGDATVNDLVMEIVESVDTKGKEIPFAGNFRLNVKDGSKVELDAGVKLLPGAQLIIDEGAEFVITENGRLMVYDANEYFQPDGYPKDEKNAYTRYRVAPEYMYGLGTPAKFILNGKLIVNGGTAGRIISESAGIAVFSPSAMCNLEIKHVEGHSSKEPDNGLLVVNNYWLKDGSGTIVDAKGTYLIKGASMPWVTEVTFINEGGEKEIIEQTYGTRYVFPKWVKDFPVYWYSEASGGKPVILETVDKVLYDTVYARTNVETKAVTFETNGGTNIKEYIVPLDAYLDANKLFTPSKQNAVFIGWYYDSDLTRPYDANKKIVDDLTLYARWAEGGFLISVEPSTVSGEGKRTTIKATVTNGYGEPLEGIEILFRGGGSGGGYWEETKQFTDLNGHAETEYISKGPFLSGNTKEILKITEQTSYETATIKVTTDASCPFVYSYNGDEYYFEHESFPFAVNSALETTSYGTLRKLQEVGGKYHVRVAEKLDEKSYLHGFTLFAIDYPADAGIKDVFADIFGDVHTIKDKIAPIEFVDSEGNNWLKEVTMKDQLVSSGQDALNDGKHITSYIATFDKPQNASSIAKLMVRTQKTPLITHAWAWFLDKVNSSKNMWWMEKVMELPENHDKFVGFIDMVNLRIELWNGEEWVEKGQIRAGRHLLEEFLIPLDISGIGREVGEIKVRLTSGTGLYEIDQISIDFSKDQIANIIELEPDEVLFNGVEDVKDVIGVFNDGVRIKMLTGDEIDLFYDVPKLADGHERGFTVAIKGYYHMDADSKEKPIPSEWDDKDTNGIIEALYNMGDEDAIEIMSAFGWMSGLIESLYGAPLEEKIEKTIVDHVLPWLMDGQ